MSKVNHALMCPFLLGKHITIAYFSNITRSERDLINSAWRRYVKQKVTPYRNGGRNIYVSQQGIDFDFAKPLSTNAKSVLIKGRLETMIYRFRDHLLKLYPKLRAHLSNRFPYPHVEVTRNWRTLNLGPVLLLVE